MKKTAFAIAVVIAGFASEAQADLKGNTWYTGGKLGWSQFHDTGWYVRALNNDSQVRESQLGVGAFGGYQVNRYVGFETGYDWLGRASYRETAINGVFKAQGVQLTAKVGYPVTDDMDVYTRLGGIVWRVSSSSNNITGGIHDHDAGISPVLVGGVEWVMTGAVTTRLEYQWINNIGDGNTIGVRPDNGTLSLGISYHFGQQEAAPVAISASDPSLEVQTKHLTLKSDVLFDFNKSTLKPEGQRTLDQMYSQLSNMDLKDSYITVLGFTDRIGYSYYNQGLSEKRAQSIVDYLVFKGIPSVKISARGMGESHPVTGNTCDNVKARAMLIDCLAQDRRVEIEVQGIKDISIQPGV